MEDYAIEIYEKLMDSDLDAEEAKALLRGVIQHIEDEEDEEHWEDKIK